MANQISTQTISFNNQSLITVEQNGNHYVAMKPICENIGLAWEPQVLRIKRDEVLSQGMIVMIIPTNGGNQNMICLPIEYLNGWLFGIDINRCKPEIRDTLIKYKKECYQALHDYWFNGKAERKTTVDDRTGLRNAVNMLVSKKGLDRINPPYVVEVMYDVEDNIPAWIGTCDKLHLVTEGRTYEELQQRVWEIAPEMHELQGYGSESDNIRLSFIQTASHADFQRLEM